MAEENLANEDVAEAIGNEHIGADQAEGQHAGHGAAIELEPVHHREQRRQQNGDKGNVHRNQVLAQHPGQQQGAEQQHFHRAPGAGLDAANDGVGQQLGQARIGNGDGKGAQHRIGQGRGGAGGDALFKDVDGVFQLAEAVQGRIIGQFEAGADLVGRNLGHQATHQGADDEAKDHVDAQQGQQQHQQHGQHHRIQE